MKDYVKAFHIFMNITGGQKLAIFKIFFSFLLKSIFDLLYPLSIAGIIAVITEKQDINKIWIYVILCILIDIAYYGAFAIQKYTAGKLHNYYYNFVQQKIFNHIVENNMIIKDISKNKIIEACSQDARYLIDIVVNSCEIISDTLKLLIIFCIFISYNIFVAIIAIFVDLLYCHFMNRSAHFINHHYEGTRKYQDKIIDILNQIINNLHQVKIFNIIGNLEKKLLTTRKSWLKHSNGKNHYTIYRYSVIPLIICSGEIILYILLAYLVFNDQLTIDRLVLLASYYSMVTTNTDSILEKSLDLEGYVVRLNRINTILEYNNFNDIDYGDLDNDYINGLVIFDNVYFDVKDKHILSNVSFKAEPNRITAIVGQPGSGKTTIINLLYRLYHVKSGSILIDDQSIYNYSKKVYSTNISGVFQKAFIFEMSIRDNLSLIDSSIKNQIAACKRVGIYKEIEKLPYGFNTIIDLDSGVLTEGQLQKLAIVRALLSKSEILLFDEVTSNIDPSSTNDIIDILNDLKNDHTIIITTHKPEIMEIADDIVVLKEGKVVAKGKNSKVFEKSAIYRKLRTATFARPSLNDEFLTPKNDDVLIES